MFLPSTLVNFHINVSTVLKYNISVYLNIYVHNIAIYTMCVYCDRNRFKVCIISWCKIKNFLQLKTFKIITNNTKHLKLNFSTFIDQIFKIERTSKIDT